MEPGVINDFETYSAIFTLIICICFALIKVAAEQIEKAIDEKFDVERAMAPKLVFHPLLSVCPSFLSFCLQLFFKSCFIILFL